MVDILIIQFVWKLNTDGEVQYHEQYVFVNVCIVTCVLCNVDMYQTYYNIYRCNKSTQKVCFTTILICPTFNEYIISVLTFGYNILIANRTNRCSSYCKSFVAQGVCYNIIRMIIFFRCLCFICIYLQKVPQFGNWQVQITQ